MLTLMVYSLLFFNSNNLHYFISNQIIIIRKDNKNDLSTIKNLTIVKKRVNVLIDELNHLKDAEKYFDLTLKIRVKILKKQCQFYKDYLYLYFMLSKLKMNLAFFIEIMEVEKPYNFYLLKRFCESKTFTKQLDELKMNLEFFIEIMGIEKPYNFYLLKKIYENKIFTKQEKYDLLSATILYNDRNMFEYFLNEIQEGIKITNDKNETLLFIGKRVYIRSLNRYALEYFQLFLENGVDINKINNENETVLDLYYNEKLDSREFPLRRKIREFLISNGAKRGCEIQKTDCK